VVFPAPDGLTIAVSPPAGAMKSRFLKTGVEPWQKPTPQGSPLGNLRDCVTLEIVRKMTGPHRGLLASKLGKKASTNLGAIQTPITLSNHFV
ncbi:MAG: hypothetical protein LCH80_14895, partial [Proteobacteria bacterium]|nr:hypothetical protein [Pseudomonadota bacterium]